MIEVRGLRDGVIALFRLLNSTNSPRDVTGPNLPFIPDVYAPEMFCPGMLLWVFLQSMDDV